MQTQTIPISKEPISTTVITLTCAHSVAILVRLANLQISEFAITLNVLPRFVFDLLCFYNHIDICKDKILPPERTQFLRNCRENLHYKHIDIVEILTRAFPLISAGTFTEHLRPILLP